MLLFMDSFAHYTTTTAMGKKWQNISGVANVGPSYARPGSAGGVQIAGNNTTALIPGSQTVFITFAFRVNDPGAALVVNILNVSGQVGLVYMETTTGTIQAQRGSFQGQLAISVAGLIVAGIWYHVQIRWTATPSSAAGDLRVLLQNQQVLDVPASSNTDQTATGIIQRINPQCSNCQISDFVIHDDQAESPQSYIGDVRVGCSFPVGNGDASDLTNSASTHVDNYTYVDETTPDDDSTYVESNVIGDRDLYDFTNVASDVDLILGVQTLNYAKKVTAGSRQIVTVVKIGGVEYDSEAKSLEDDYVYKRHILGVDPSTGDPWTAASFNAAQFGPKISL